MVTDELLESMNLYKGVMVEIVERKSSINYVLIAERLLRDTYKIEYCFLQLRIICELIALGCLIAHGDIVAKSPKSLMKAYMPSEMMSAIEKLHEHFYPMPGKWIQTKSGPSIDLTAAPRPILTKQELLKLWGRSGDILHRGSLKNYKGNRVGVSGITEIAEWQEKISNLLLHHITGRVDSTLVYAVWMIPAVDKVDVNVSLLQRPN